MRRLIALAVIALHVLLVWLLAIGFRQRIDQPQEQPQFVSLWLWPSAVIADPLPANPPPPKVAPPKRRAEIPPPVAPVTVPIMPVPVPAEPKPESTASRITLAPAVDFARAAELAARHLSDAEVAAEKRGDGFSPAPAVVAKACVPKKRSMEWKGASDPGLHWYGPIPVLVTKRCAFTLGAFACAIGKLPPANGHLLDDMQDPDQPRSSVPDPNVCD